MRIAFILNGFPILSETFILNQITGLLDRGHEVEIFPQTIWYEPRVHADVARYNLLNRTYPLRLERTNSSTRWNAFCLILKNIHRPGLLRLMVEKLLQSRRFLTALKQLYPVALLQSRGPFDVIHCHFGSNGIYVIYLKSMLAFPGKIVTTFHGHDLTKHIAERGNDIYKKLFKKGDLFLSISQLFKEKLIQLGCDESKVRIHRTGVDISKFSKSPGPQKNIRGLRILSVARLVEIKGIEFGIRAVSMVLNKYKDIVYGIAGDGPLKEKLQNVIELLKVGNHITLLGWQSQEDVIELLRSTDILLAPSVSGSDGNQEGIPVVIMEAMALGIPVLSTYHSGIPELVRDGEWGFLVPERDIDALAQKLEFLIKHPEIRSEMGVKGRQFVEEQYNIEKWNDRLVELYEQLKADKL